MNVNLCEKSNVPFCGEDGNTFFLLPFSARGHMKNVQKLVPLVCDCRELKGGIDVAI